MPRTRIYSDGTNDFILEPVNESVVKVTHRDQTGYIGINVEWDAASPYSWCTLPDSAQPSGVRNAVARFSTPDQALSRLCRLLLSEQSKADSQKINPEERQAAARQVLQEFFHGLPPAPF